MAGTPPDTEQPESVTATPPDTEQEPAPVTSPDTESKPGGRQLQWRDVPIEPSEWKAEHAPILGISSELVKIVATAASDPKKAFYTLEVLAKTKPAKCRRLQQELGDWLQHMQAVDAQRTQMLAILKGSPRGDLPSQKALQAYYNVHHEETVEQIDDMINTLELVKQELYEVREANLQRPDPPQLPRGLQSAAQLRAAAYEEHFVPKQGHAHPLQELLRQMQREEGEQAERRSRRDAVQRMAEEMQALRTATKPKQDGEEH